MLEFLPVNSYTFNMEYISAEKAAEKWGISPRSVRNYCANGRIPGAFIIGKTWNIPENTEKPFRKRKDSLPKTLLHRLKAEMESGIHGGIYHRIQVDLTYNSNHIEGSTLTHEQTRLIFETKTVMPGETGILRTDDIVETANHFKCIDLIIKNAHRSLNASFIKVLHRTLKNGTSDSRKNWFAVGEYKKLPNEVGGSETANPEDVNKEINSLLKEYNLSKEKTLDELLDFHWRFERIHPFQDGNGRVGRLILFKECLRCGIVPFIITEELKLFYYRGLAHWPREKCYLRDTCFASQDQFKKILDYFRIPY